jgi:hypothetical protein
MTLEGVVDITLREELHVEWYMIRNARISKYND